MNGKKQIELLVGMEDLNKIKVTRLILMALLFFILWGCSNTQQRQLAKQDQTPVNAKNDNISNIAVNTQKPAEVQSDKTTVIKVKGGGELCEDYLLKKIAKQKAVDNRIVKLKAFNTTDETLSPTLKEWLETADKEKLVSFELRHKEKKALILGSSNVQATGLAANFQYWYIGLVGLDSYSIEFISLSEDPNFIFWDKDGLLNYYSVDYSDKFLEKKDWDNLILKLLRYSISPEGKSHLVSEERNVKCE